MNEIKSHQDHSLLIDFAYNFPRSCNPMLSIRDSLENQERKSWQLTFCQTYARVT